MRRVGRRARHLGDRKFKAKTQVVAPLSPIRLLLWGRKTPITRQPLHLELVVWLITLHCENYRLHADFSRAIYTGENTTTFQPPVDNLVTWDDGRTTDTGKICKEFETPVLRGSIANPKIANRIGPWNVRTMYIMAKQLKYHQHPGSQ